MKITNLLEMPFDDVLDWMVDNQHDYELMLVNKEATDKVKDTLELYQEAINKIDDYFEYRNESQKDRFMVYSILSGLTEKLRRN